MILDSIARLVFYSDYSGARVKLDSLDSFLSYWEIFSTVYTPLVRVSMRSLKFMENTSTFPSQFLSLNRKFY